MRVAFLDRPDVARSGDAPADEPLANVLSTARYDGLMALKRGNGVSLGDPRTQRGCSGLHALFDADQEFLESTLPPPADAAVREFAPQAVAFLRKHLVDTYIAEFVTCVLSNACCFEMQYCPLLIEAGAIEVVLAAAREHAHDEEITMTPACSY